jgi:large subunit ribosomal protein L17
MRHLKKGRKLGTDSSHTTAMLRSLAIAVFTHERIKTTEARAKEVRTLVEKIVTWGKKGDVHSRRLAMAELGDKELVHKIFAEIAPRYEERQGGYTRILKLGPRKGDAAPMVILELVE